VLLACGSPPVGAEERYKAERVVVADRRKDQVEPQVADNWVVWKDYRSASLRAVDDSPNGEIFAYDLATNEEFQVSKTKDAGQPAVSDRLVVWTEGSGPTTEIHGMNLDERKVFALTVSSGRQESPAIDGQLVVWQDNRNGNWDIFARDLAEDGDYALVLHTADQDRPALSGRTVVWQDWRDRGRGPDIMGLDVESGETFRVTETHDAYEPAVSGRWVVWVGAADPAVFAKNLDDGRQLRLSTAGGPKSQPSIAGDLVVWTDERHGNRDVYGYDLKTRVEFEVARAHGDQDAPHVDGPTIVWSDGRGPNRDVSLAYLGVPAWKQTSPEPAVAAPAPAVTQTSPPAATTPGAPTISSVTFFRVAGTGGAGVNLRVHPGIDAAKVKTLSEGTILHATGEVRQADGLIWRAVRDPQGASGWVAADYLTPA
jgi:beta propeller repeat protein